MALKLLYEGGPFLFGATTGKLSCACCCYPTCPSPTIQWKSRSASKTKFGSMPFDAFWDGAADTYRRFLRVDWYGTVNETQYASSPCSGSSYLSTVQSASGYATASDSSACDTFSSLQTRSIGYNSSGAVVYDYTNDYNPAATCPGTFFYGGPGIARNPFFYGTASYTETGFTKTGMGCNGSDRSISGVGGATLSNEYTTSTLKSNTTAALSAYTSTWTGTAGSYYNLTTDELTNSIRQAKYRFEFTVPEMCGAAMCYKIEWTEGVTAKSYTYTGTDPAGTTLYTGEYEIPIPTTNSTVTVTGISSTCTGC